MNKEIRLNQIIQIVEEKKFASVNDLSDLLQVSPITIRRDLIELSTAGYLIRCRGGAKCISKGQIALPFGYRQIENANIKNRIAQTASRFLHDNMVVFVDASSSCAPLANYFRNFHNLIVITNNLSLASSLKYQNVRVFCLGGEILDYACATAGPIAIEAAKNFCIDVMFFSSYGINNTGLIIDPAEKETQLRQSILENVSTSVFLCDQSKFYRTATFVLAPLSKVDYFVTDAEVPEQYRCIRKEVLIAP